MSMAGKVAFALMASFLLDPLTPGNIACSFFPIRGGGEIPQKFSGPVKGEAKMQSLVGIGKYHSSRKCDSQTDVAKSIP